MSAPPLTTHRSVTIPPRTAPPESQQNQETESTPAKTLPRALQLEAFIQMAQQGVSVGKALKASGILTSETNQRFNSSDPGEEIVMEDLFYKRCATKFSKDDKQGLITDEQYSRLSPEQYQQHVDNGFLSTTQLYKLVDWLYFVRRLPIKAIANSIQVDVAVVAKVKGALSDEFAKTIRLQSAEGYIADLMRTKELIVADLMFRKSRLGDGNSQQLVLNKLLWEIENRFIDRLQEIGIIDKNLGRMDVHEEWHVSIGPAGQPVNTKMKELPTSLDGDEAFQEAEVIAARPETSPDSDRMPLASDLDPAQLRAAASQTQSATIRVGGE